MTRVQRFQAMRAGRVAGASDLPATACPYSTGDDTGRALASAWIREWFDAHPSAHASVSYDD